MSTNQQASYGRDTAGTVIACLFIIMAVVALWDTTNMMDSDSYVFPRTVASAMIFFSLLLIVRNLLQPAAEQRESIPGASNIRRIALVVVMLISCALMPWLGFLLSGMATFLLLMMVAMYDEWTPQRKLIYPLVAVTIVIGFYMLFTQLLLVPLPSGTFFD